MRIARPVPGSEALSVPAVDSATVPPKKAQASNKACLSHQKLAFATPRSPRGKLDHPSTRWSGEGHAIRRHDVRYRLVCRKTGAFAARTGGV